jgi:sensor histidine kinase YesM
MIKTGNRNFWIAQIFGWTLLSGSILAIQFTAGLPMEKILYNSLTPMLVGFILTSVYRYIIRKLDWRNWSLNKTLVFLIGSTFILTSVFMLAVFIVIRFAYGLHALGIAGFLGNMFTFTLIILTWNLIYFSIHYFNNWTAAELEKWKLAAEIKDAQLGSLKSQIQPHFVFNTINNIRSLILEDKEKAREMLLNFSDMFRYALKNTSHSKVKLGEELEIVNQYLELLSIQYEDKLQYKIHVEEDLEDLKLPPMMLQLLVENAVKHGISQFTEGGTILIDIKQAEKFLNIEVRNTGNLNASSTLEDHLGVGLENIRKRLDLIYSGKATMNIREIDNHVLAAIKIPVI